MKLLVLLVCLSIALMALPAFAADEPVKAVKTVTIDAKDLPAADVFKKIGEATGSTILPEKLVNGKVTVNLKDSSLEDAIRTVCKAGDYQWLKAYVPAGSVYSKDGTALAVQVRLLLGLKLPDIVVTPPAAYDPVVHLQKKDTAKPIIDGIKPESGLVPVYLVTNDKAYANKQASADAKEKADKYTQMAKELMDMFLSMSPEERVEAMKQGMQMQMQMSPQAMQEMMQAVFQMDPTYLADMNNKAMSAMMSMDPAVRKNFLKMSMKANFEMMKNMNPEQMKQFQQETMEIVKEMQDSGEMPKVPGMPGQ